MKNALLLLKEKKIRPTLARLQILTVLEAAEDGRLLVESIYRSLMATGDPISLPTVYRILNKMAAGGLVERVWGRDGTESRLYYRLRRNDLSALDHELVCGKCQRHMTVQLPGLREELNRQGQAHGLQPESGPILLQVTCAACLAGTGSATGGGSSANAPTADTSQDD